MSEVVAIKLPREDKEIFILSAREYHKLMELNTRIGILEVALLQSELMVKKLKKVIVLLGER